MYAVFFACQSIEIEGVANPSIHVFETEELADDFVFDKLVEAGEIVTGQWHGEYEVDGDRYADRSEAVQAVLMGLNAFDFFYVYPAVDHRPAAIRANS